jgi:hypothetical protein
MRLDTPVLKVVGTQLKKNGSHAYNNSGGREAGLPLENHGGFPGSAEGKT